MLKLHLYYTVIVQVIALVLAGKSQLFNYQLYASDYSRAPVSNIKWNISNFLNANKVEQISQLEEYLTDPLPFMYVLGWKANHSSVAYKCGGVLIAPELVLTTAHCIYETNILFRTKPIQVRPEIDFGNIDMRPIRIGNIRIHPGYDHLSTNDDIAVIELERAAPTTAIKLKLNNDIREDLALLENSYITCNGKLLEVSISNCSGQPLNMPLEEQNNYHQICFLPETKHHQCQSSTGFSLILSAVNGWYTLLGISCTKCSMDTFTHLPKYIDWILEIPDWQGKLPYKYVLGWESESQHGVIDYRCGGILIGPFSVITAAHCLYDSNKMPTSVRLEYNSEAMPIKISKISIHPGYNHPSFRNDIALIQLEKKVPRYRIVLFPFFRKHSVPHSVICEDKIIGVSLVNCTESILQNIEENISPYLCVNNTDVIRQKCQNSKSPSLLAQVSNGKYQVALNGIECATCSTGVYTNLAAYILWLREQDYSTFFRICPPVPSPAGPSFTFPGEFPFMFALGWKSDRNDGTMDYKCGGVLIHPQYVLTAAHCLYDSEFDPIVVRPNGADLNETDVKDISIAEIFEHPDYNPKLVYNDLALIKLEWKAVNPHVHYWIRDTFMNNSILILGYGDQKFAGVPSHRLLKANLELISNEECRKYYDDGPLSFTPMNIIDTQVCADDPLKYRDACQGDSGGPIIMNVTYDQTKIRTFVVGITSFGKGCASGVPGVYTRVSKYIDWIISKICEPGEYCTFQRPKPVELNFDAVYEVGWAKTRESPIIEYKCTGIVISNDGFIIPAHCIYEQWYSSKLIPIELRSLINKTATPFAIENIEIHPEYRYTSAYHDLAIIKPVETPYSSTNIWKRDKLDDKYIFAFGYDETVITGFSNTLMTNHSLLPHDECKRSYATRVGATYGNHSFEGTHFCTTDSTNSPFSATGGPIILSTKDLDERTHRFILGLETRDIGYLDGTPRIYTRISNYLKWIYPTFWKYDKCSA